MRSLPWFLVSMALTLGLSPAVMAQDRDNAAADVLVAGMANGVVQEVDRARGRVTVKTDARTLTLHATPAQLAGLDAGDQAALPWGIFRGERWVVPRGGELSGVDALSGVPIPEDKQGHLTGLVEDLRPEDGLLIVDDETFRMHPALMKGLEPGQFVSLSYGRVGDTSWVRGIDVRGAVAVDEPVRQEKRVLDVDEDLGRVEPGE